jgi:hypothetical protein
LRATTASRLAEINDLLSGLGAAEFTGALEGLDLTRLSP